MQTSTTPMPAIEPLEGRAFLTAAHGFVYTPHSKVLGKTLGQWAGDWVNWALKSPTNVNPLLDTTGKNAKVGQPGKVFFLAGTNGTGKVTRKTTIPAGEPIFFPIVNNYWVNVDKVVPGKVETPDPPFATNEANIRDALRGAAAGIKDLFATVDGKPVYSLSSHREEDPKGGFKVTFPDDNITGLPAYALGDHSATVGVYLMLKPLSPGTHTIHFGGRNAVYNPDITQDATYNITVTSPPANTADTAVVVKASPAAAGAFKAVSSIDASVLDDQPSPAA